MNNKSDLSDRLKSIMGFFKEWKSSDDFDPSNSKTDERIDLLVKAYEGDSDALIEASKDLNYDN